MSFNSHFTHCIIKPERFKKEKFEKFNFSKLVRVLRKECDKKWKY